ncbi:4Fe-4S binding protein [Parabacteroides sp. FAFU027]|uniref:4Fe-4S binding protein n=1 Tax=Parabacteroides sp. FAFU027 TaxID=2922715 RepID=UPI001FAEA52E|nr:4Fe-4S binding protein [Parabacteroides sp. FAFU027]
MKSIIKYFRELVMAFYSLAQGMKLTLYYFTHVRKVNITEQYPENRETTIRIPERFYGILEMPHDENNEHNCTACTLCELACPNGTITIDTAVEVTEDGKKKKYLDKYHYNLGTCTFCGQCVDACPSDAIHMNKQFELSEYDKNKLLLVLNKPGSKLKAKEKKS